MFSTIIATIYTYFTAHPEHAVALVVAVLTALTAVFKPKSAEEYAAMNPYAAAFWKAMAALLPDLVKFAKVLPQLLNGTSDPSKEPAKSEEVSQ